MLLTGMYIMLNLQVHCLLVGVKKAGGSGQGPAKIPDTQRNHGINTASIPGCSLRPFCGARD